MKTKLAILLNETVILFRGTKSILFNLSEIIMSNKACNICFMDFDESEIGKVDDELKVDLLNVLEYKVYSIY